MRPALTSVRFWLTLSAAAIFSAGIVGRVLAAGTVVITSPMTDQVISGNKVLVKFEVKGTKLVDYKTYPRNGYNQGHLHLWLDQGNPTKTSAIKLTSDSYTFENVKEGNHTLLVELVNNDHSSLNPKVTSSVNFKTVVPMSEKNNSLLIISISTFLFLCIALYFIYPKTKVTPKTHTSPVKSSHKSSKKK